MNTANLILKLLHILGVTVWIGASSPWSCSTPAWGGKAMRR